MSYHFTRPEAEQTYCGVSLPLVTHVLRTNEEKLPLPHDLILPAMSRNGLVLSDVCPDCLRLRRLPWAASHGQTKEDEYADDDENWRQKFIVDNEPMVD